MMRERERKVGSVHNCTTVRWWLCLAYLVCWLVKSYGLASKQISGGRVHIKDIFPPQIAQVMYNATYMFIIAFGLKEKGGKRDSNCLASKEDNLKF